MALIKGRYPSANNQENLLKEYRACAVTFDGLWKKYSARLKQVKEAVAAASKLKADKKPVEAMSALEAVITKVEIPKKDHLGRSKPARRGLLEVRDAELAALIDYATLAVEQRKLDLLPYVQASFQARRQVSTGESVERIAWLAGQCGKHKRAAQGRFNGFAAGQKPEAGKAMGARQLLFPGEGEMERVEQACSFVAWQRMDTAVQEGPTT